MKIDGLGSDERVFGSFGPGAPRDVLADLLDGTAYNLVLLGDLSNGAPRELILSPATHAGAAAPSPAPQVNADEASNEQESVEVATTTAGAAGTRNNAAPHTRGENSAAIIRAVAAHAPRPGRNPAARATACAAGLTAAVGTVKLSAQSSRGKRWGRKAGGEVRASFTKEGPKSSTPGSNLNHLRLRLCALCRRQPSMETQDIKQGLAAHIAQHHTEREGGDRRTKHHQHTYFIFHNGPSNPEFWLAHRASFAHSRCR